MTDSTPRLFVQSYDVARWIHQNLAPGEDVAQRARDASFELVEAVSLALHGHERELHLERADVRLVRLRLALRLARDLGRIEDRSLLHVLALVDEVGRQVGGWRKRLDAE